MAIKDANPKTDDIWVTLDPDPKPRRKQPAQMAARSGWLTGRSQPARSPDDLDRIIDAFRHSGQI